MLLVAFSLGAAAAAGVHAVVRRTRRSNAAPASTLGPLNYVHPPHRSWVPGQAQPHPFASDAMVDFDPEVVDKGAMYSLLISAVVPRPIGFVSTIGVDGTHNLSPYSYFNTVHMHACTHTGCTQACCAMH